MQSKTSASDHERLKDDLRRVIV